MNDLAPAILKVIQERDPLAFGNLVVSNQSKHFTVTGRLHSSIDRKDLNKLIQEIVTAEDSSRIVFTSIECPRRGLTVRTDNGKAVTEATTRRRETKPLDEMSVIFYGLVDRTSITPNKKFKKVNHETFDKVKNAIMVLGIIAPILVDKNFKVIDGNMRLEIARILEMDQIPVMVVDDEGAKSEFLRLATNRSTEFQRWNFAEVDEYVDSVPQAQPLLEPLGFFGNKILPTSFFGKTVMGYQLDEYNDQQKKYSQDIGLAAWAEEMRKKTLRAENKKKAAREKKAETKNRVSLFDLIPQESDFLPTYDAPAEIRKNTLEMQELAGVITEKFDAKRKAEMEEKGVMWQNTRQTSQELADAKRAAAEAEAKLKKSSGSKKAAVPALTLVPELPDVDEDLEAFGNDSLEEIPEAS
jgi:hypothetical protein